MSGLPMHSNPRPHLYEVSVRSGLIQKPKAVLIGCIQSLRTDKRLRGDLKDVETFLMSLFTLGRSLSIQSQMKYYSLGLLFILISCSTKEKNQGQEKAEPVVQRIESSVPPRWEKFDLKIRIDAYFGSIEDLVVENEFGGGDCWHSVKEYQTSIQNSRVVSDNLDCGDYGFTRSTCSIIYGKAINP